MSFGTPDVRTPKRERTRAEILAAASELVGRDGIAGLSLRDLAARAGMRAPSLYTYFPSKNALYDAMFAEGMRCFAEQIGRSPGGRSGGEPVRLIPAHTADAAALLDILGAESAVVAGISVAATIAIDLASRRPDLVCAVIAYDSPWHVARYPPTAAQIAALSKMSWLALRGNHADRHGHPGRPDA